MSGPADPHNPGYWGKRRLEFAVSDRTPHLARKAATKLGYPSMTTYMQRVVCEALSRDLGIPLEELLAELPNSNHRKSKGRYPIESVH